MQPQPQAPIRLASEDVIISAPMSYAGSAQRILRLRRRADAGAPLAAITVSPVVLVIAAWVLVTAWYLEDGVERVEHARGHLDGRVVAHQPDAPHRGR